MVSWARKHGLFDAHAHHQPCEALRPRPGAEHARHDADAVSMITPATHFRM
jgi:hypothetical protein